MNLGQVYTKDIVSDFMVSLIDLPKDAYIVDPCFGRGVFVKSLQKENFTNITGVEIDPETFKLIDFDDYTGCNLINKDFFQFEPSCEIDGFILNPPYVRQEEIDNMSLLGITKESIVSKCGDFNIYSKANLYLYFIARCITLLKDGGEFVAIFPNAWVNTPDGKGFMSQIESKGFISNLIQVIGYPFVGNPLVDVMILKFIKGRTGYTKNETLIINGNELTISKGKSQVVFDSLSCVPLYSFANIRRGVTTGFNKVFINPPLESDKIKTDILSTPKDVVGYSTKNAKFDKLLILSANEELSSDIVAYLEKSEKLILQERKPKTLVNQIENKKVWYVIKTPTKSDLIFPYIIRDSVRFIYNEAKVIARDNFYTISSEHNPLLIMALLNNLFVFSQLELCGKSYGNGLLKIQKYDIDNIVVPNPNVLSNDTVLKLVDCSKKLIETRDSKYILESTSILSKYYKIDNIEDIYNSQKANRLKYEL